MAIKETLKKAAGFASPAYGLYRLSKKKSLNDKIEEQANKVPEYKVQEEAFQNQALARSRAFGRDRNIQMQEQNIEQEAANAAGEARDVTGSTSGLLSTIAAINANKGEQLRGLAQDEAQVQASNVNQLYGANQQMIDEQDKAFNQNEMAPWDIKLRLLQQKKQNRANITNTIVGSVLPVIAQAGMKAATGGAA